MCIFVLMKKISIITPSFNQASFIEQTIDSVLSQNYPNLEYIIIDGGSTDGSVEIIKRYEKYLSYWVSEKDKGQSHAINKGFAKASGEIINWLNSDDFYEPNCFSIISERFKEDTIQIVSGRSNVLKGKKILYQTRGVDLYPNEIKTMAYARIDQPETFIRKSVLDKIGNINEHFHYLMDREWWLRYLLNYGSSHVQSIDDVLVNFRLHEDSKTVTASPKFEKESLSLYYSLAKEYQLEEAKYMQDHFDVVQMPLLGYNLSKPKELIQQIIHNFWLQQAEVAYAADQYNVAKSFLNGIDVKFLTIENQAVFSKVKTRITLLPVFLKRLLNRN